MKLPEIVRLSNGLAQVPDLTDEELRYLCQRQLELGKIMKTLGEEHRKNARLLMAREEYLQAFTDLCLGPAT